MLLVADNLTVTNTAIREALNTRDPSPIRRMVQRCEQSGAEAIDINSGPLTRDPEERMRFLVETVQAATDLPLLLDTVNPKALEAGLQACDRPAIINGFSLEPARLNGILPLARKYDVRIIGYLLDSDGHVPPDSTGRLSVAARLFEAFRKAGIDQDQLIIDPIVPPLAWQDGSQQAAQVLEVLRHLPDVLGFSVPTIAGLSNLITGGGPLEKKLLLERAYLSMLASAGLTMALFNILHTETVITARACRALTTDRIFTWEEIG